MAVSCLEEPARSCEVGLSSEASRNMCRRLNCCISHHVQTFFDRMHDHLRRAGRRDASLDDVEWVYVRGMLGVRGQVDLQHYDIEAISGQNPAQDHCGRIGARGKTDAPSTLQHASADTFP